jgi:aspartate 1-decarboxylase
MKRTLLKSKLHRARITDCSISYIGSIGIDEELMEAADIIPYEKVLVADINNGNRLETYAIPTPRGSGKITILGAAGRLVEEDDMVIIMSFASYSSDEAADHKPKVIFVDDENRQVPGNQ